jgi:hypothetical protein
VRELAEGLWVHDAPFRVAGLRVGTRMTVARLADGSLFLHSPVALDAALRAELEAQGEVRHVVAPNRHHHLFLPDYRELPGVRLYATPGLPEKRKDLRFDEVLGDEAPLAWRGQLDQHVFRGARFLGETLFFHRGSRTLLTADLFFNFVHCDHRFTRWWLRAMGALGRFSVPRQVRWGIRDQRAARTSADAILRWDVQRVVVTHGVVLQQSAKRLVREALAFLPDAEPG